jgi:hypothetical protein
MKLGLITIHRVTNYGAILQAFASKQVLSRYCKVYTIDYRNSFLDRKMQLIRFEMSLKGLKMMIHDILNVSNRIKLVRNFNAFLESEMNMTKSVSAKELEANIFYDFDAFVCGSDQIWNPSIVSESREIDPIYFLSFAKENTLKFSLASSIGHHKYDQEEKVEVMNYLSKFKSISIREADGKKKIEEILPNRKIEHVLDPTLFLSKNEWIDLFNIEVDSNREDYILVYSVPRLKMTGKAAQYFSKKLNMKIVTIDKMMFPVTKVNKHYKNATPKDFLTLYANASFVVTDSFHGTCFAVNFEKPFVCVPAGIKANRQESLLELLGIKSRIAYSEKDFKKLDLQYDLNLVESKLSKLRNDSLKFIEDAIQSS